ncbi:hypothetical protein V4F39_03960 [Aquincola sp. MAHUQ-54]|uniref:Uncharacterized protein n=1 Tax=Aquincola agrisoli TaxID=3119538 RepID=A0AAW9QDB7_9BURK
MDVAREGGHGAGVLIRELEPTHGLAVCTSAAGRPPFARQPAPQVLIGVRIGLHGSRFVSLRFA